MRGERRKSIEFHRGIARRVDARCYEVDGVADRQCGWQCVVGAIVNDVGTVTGRTRENHRLAWSSVVRRPNRIMNALARRLGKTIESSGIEIHPAALCMIAMSGDQQDLSAKNSGFCPGSIINCGAEAPKWRLTAPVIAST